MEQQTVLNEVARLQKMIDRKEQEIKEHKQLIEMWQKQIAGNQEKK